MLDLVWNGLTQLWNWLGTVTPEFEAMGKLAAVGALAFGAFQLWGEFRWRKKQQAVQMLAEWNRNTAKHRLEIDLEFAGLLDDSGPHAGTTLTERTAGVIHDADARGNRKYVELRGHFVEMLNYCEYVAVASENGAAHRKLLLGSLGMAIHRWFHALEPFVRHVGEHRSPRGVHPWMPLEKFLKDHICKSDCLLRKRVETLRRLKAAEEHLFEIEHTLAHGPSAAARTKISGLFTDVETCVSKVREVLASNSKLLTEDGGILAALESRLDRVATGAEVAKKQHGNSECGSMSG